MSILSAQERSRCLSAITRIDGQIESLHDALDDNIASIGIKEFRFDSGEGSQRVEYRSVADIEHLIYTLERRRQALVDKLDGSNVVTVNVRRKIGCGVNRGRSV